MTTALLEPDKDMKRGFAVGWRDEPTGTVTWSVEVRLQRKPEGLTLSVSGEQVLRRHCNGQRVTLSAGQCREALDYDFHADLLADAHPRLQAILNLWADWHLNDMNAGCEHQRHLGWDNLPIDSAKPLNAYGRHFPGQESDSWNMLGWVPRDEHPKGLLCQPCPTCGYRYGTQWLFRPLSAQAEALAVQLITDPPAVVDGVRL